MAGYPEVLHPLIASPDRRAALGLGGDEPAGGGDGRRAAAAPEGLRGRQPGLHAAAASHRAGPNGADHPRPAEPDPRAPLRSPPGVRGPGTLLGRGGPAAGRIASESAAPWAVGWTLSIGTTTTGIIRPLPTTSPRPDLPIKPTDLTRLENLGRLRFSRTSARPPRLRDRPSEVTVYRTRRMRVSARAPQPGGGAARDGGPGRERRESNKPSRRPKPRWTPCERPPRARTRRPSPGSSARR